MVCAALLLSMRAHADAISPPPEDCPSGSIGTASHVGQWCTPHLCAEQPCGDRTCETTGLCVLEEERDCGGQTGSPCTFTYREAFGPCELDTDCTEGTCVTDDYCVEPAKADTGCGCSSAGGASMVFLLGLLPLAGARRRQR